MKFIAGVCVGLIIGAFVGIMSIALVTANRQEEKEEES